MDEVLFKSFPVQKLLMGSKDTAWKEACVDGTINMCTSIGRSRRSTPENKKRNYNVYNNKINKTDFTYVLNPFNLSKDRLNEFQLPASLQPYDVLSPTFNLLFGEEIKRPFSPIVRGINESILSVKQEKKKQTMMELYQQLLESEFGKDNPLTEQEIKNKINYTPKDVREMTATHLLTHYKKKLNIQDSFQTGWKDALIAGEEIYRIDQVGDGPRLTRVNPLEIEFVLPNNSDFIDEAPMIHEVNYMTLPEIIDEFYEYLTPAQIDDLEKRYKEGGSSVMEYMSPINISEVESIYHFGQDAEKRGIKVHRVRWKSFRKMGSLHSIDPMTGEEVEELIDENYKLSKDDLTAWIEDFWVTEYWEGIRIGADLYLNIRPRKNQFRSIDNPSSCKSGYIGTIYSALNSPSVSLMDRLIPWLYLYLIIWYNTELLFANNMGKIGLVDISLVPDGWEIEKWLYYIKAMKIGFVNSYNEGDKAARFGNVNSSTQTKQLDLELGNSIQYNIKLIEVIEQKIEMTSGISRQRKGAITSSELVGNTERAVVQSSHITEEWFRVHNGTKLRACEALIEVAKDCLQGKKKNFQYITDDLAEVLFMVDGNDFCDADYGVFLTDSIKDQKALQAFQDYLGQALQSDKIEFSQIADVFNSESIAELKNKAKQAEQERRAHEQEMQQQQQQAQQQLQETQLSLEQSKMELQKYISDSANETKITVAEIGAFSRQENLDQDGNGIPDPVDIANLALDHKKLTSDEYAQKLERESKERIEKAKLSLEKEKIKSQEEIEQLKSKTAIRVAKQNKNKYG